MVLCIDRQDLPNALAAVEALRPEMQPAAVEPKAEVASIAIFGPDSASGRDCGADVRALAGRAINILAISTSISTVNCIIALSDLKEAYAALCEQFDVLDGGPPAMVNPTTRSSPHSDAPAVPEDDCAGWLRRAWWCWRAALILTLVIARFSSSLAWADAGHAGGLALLRPGDPCIFTRVPDSRPAARAASRCPQSAWSPYRC